MLEILLTLKNKIFKKVINLLLRLTDDGTFQQISFAQEAEDLILSHHFRGKSDGLYIDIGAHHPFRFSNTYFFYKRGWHGINIDANPISIKAFKKHRPNDINLNIGISDKEEVLNYYMFNEPALNTFSTKMLEKYKNDKHYKVVEERSIGLSPLSKILDKYLIAETKIDFMNVDVEGFDLKVLKSNNWDKYRPKLIVVESFSGDLSHIGDCPVFRFLNDKNYKLVSKMTNSFIYKSTC